LIFILKDVNVYIRTFYTVRRLTVMFLFKKDVQVMLALSLFTKLPFNIYRL
jgi:hypothetical protein